MKNIVVVAVILACLQIVAGAEQIVVDGTIPGGNGRLVESEGDRHVVEYEIRDTDGWWFRWCFAVRCAQGRTLSFALRSDRFGACDGAVGDYGPAVSHDGGRTWRYERGVRCDRHGFEYSFGPDDREVRFAQCLQYDPSHWRSFLAAHEKSHEVFREETLALTSRRKRPVPMVRFGNLSSPKYRFLFTSRHHANEATATYVIEGIAAQTFAQDTLGEWIRKNVQMIVVPFVDFDGVVDGDQGKNRIPHDHNRDYHPSREPIYAEIAAIERIVRDERPDVEMDFHNPAIHSVGRLFQTGLPNPEDAERQRSFARTLERIQKGVFTYLASDDVPFGVRWNSAANYRKGQTLEHFAADTLRGNGSLVTLWEVPFANAHGGRTLSGDDFRDLGRDMIEALAVWLKRYLEKRNEIADNGDVEYDVVPFDSTGARVSVSGELRTRLLRNFDRLEESKYRPDRLFLDYKASLGWPGDTEGRTILGLVCDARATGREPRYLQEILRIFPSKLNEKGYFGPVFDHANEQQLAGHGWVLRGLCEYRRWKNDRSVDPLIRGIVKNLFLPLEGDYGDYPIDPAVHRGPSGGEAGSNAARVGRWRLSTDVGCVFIGLDGLVQVRIDLDDTSLDPSIEALVGRFLAMDLVAARAQTHASLTAMRALLRWAEFSGRKDLIAAVESRFRTYVAQGMTENYENYNWFARFNSWTEPCGIVDSYIVADNLWRLLGKTEWRDLAELIYYNGLCRTQHANGGFGLDSTPGAAATNACVSVWCKEAHWCCTMRGAEGLAAVAESTAFVRGKELVLAYWRTADLEFDLPSGRLAMTIATDYPLDDKAVVKISAAPHTDTVLKLPFPAYLSAPCVKINDEEMKVAALNGFISLSRRWQPGDVVRISFCRTRRDEGLLNADQTIRNLPMRRFFGPLQIGVDESVGEERTLYHLMDPRVHGKGSGSLRIFFKKETSR